MGGHETQERKNEQNGTRRGSGILDDAIGSRRHCRGHVACGNFKY